jgi:predicted glycosyl hydrolase (DUF1957 family)
MNWINFLHFYQPANIDAFIVKEATEKSYYRIVRALEEHPRIKFTFNISGCLVLRWQDSGYGDIIKRIKKLINNGQVELVGSASYHPILPLIPEKEAIRQIRENENILKKFFGLKRPLGFFFPEMAHGARMAKIIKKLGYKYLILDEISYNGKLGQTDFKKIYKDRNSGLKVIFRSRKMSNDFVPKIIKKELDKNNRDFIITATDAELYGLRYIDHGAEFERLLNEPKIKTLTLSEFINNKAPLPAALVDSNWESTERELKNKLSYALWHNKKNKLQMKIWKLAGLAYKASKKFAGDPNYYWAEWHLVRGFSSCTFWWASGRDFREVFGPISWGPDEIERGINEFIRSIRSLENPRSKAVKIKAEKLYNKIRQLIWNKHWKEYWKK